MASSLNHHWCVGIDLHKDTLTACVFCGCCGEYSFQKIACRCRKQIVAYFAALPRPHTVAIESVGFYRWLWEMLEPRVYASGGKQRIGHIAKTGSPDLRWILQQAAWTAIRVDDGVRQLFLRIAKRSGRKAAAVAVARKLLTWMHRAVVKGEPYRTRLAA